MTESDLPGLEVSEDELLPLRGNHVSDTNKLPSREVFHPHLAFQTIPADIDPLQLPLILNGVHRQPQLATVVVGPLNSTGGTIVPGPAGRLVDALGPVVGRLGGGGQEELFYRRVNQLAQLQGLTGGTWEIPQDMLVVPHLGTLVDVAGLGPGHASLTHHPSSDTTNNRSRAAHRYASDNAVLPNVPWLPPRSSTSWLQSASFS